MNDKKRRRIALQPADKPRKGTVMRSLRKPSKSAPVQLGEEAQSPQLITLLLIFVLGIGFFLWAVSFLVRDYGPFYERLVEHFFH